MRIFTITGFVILTLIISGCFSLEKSAVGITNHSGSLPNDVSASDNLSLQIRDNILYLEGSKVILLNKEYLHHGDWIYKVVSENGLKLDFSAGETYNYCYMITENISAYNATFFTDFKRIIRNETMMDTYSINSPEWCTIRSSPPTMYSYIDKGLYKNYSKVCLYAIPLYAAYSDLNVNQSTDDYMKVRNSSNEESKRICIRHLDRLKYAFTLISEQPNFGDHNQI